MQRYAFVASYLDWAAQISGDDLNKAPYDGVAQVHLRFSRLTSDQAFTLALAFLAILGTLLGSLFGARQQHHFAVEDERRRWGLETKKLLSRLVYEANAYAIVVSNEGDVHRWDRGFQFWDKAWSEFRDEFLLHMDLISLVLPPQYREAVVLRQMTWIQSMLTHDAAQVSSATSDLLAAAKALMNEIDRWLGFKPIVTGRLQ
jgi:hypothetical protein